MYKLQTLEKEVIQMKLPLRHQDAKDARTIGYRLRKADNRICNQTKRKKFVVVNKDEGHWRSERHFDIRHGDSEFGGFPLVSGLAMI